MTFSATKRTMGTMLVYMLMTLDSFWTLFRRRSPFLMVSWYCQFLLSGLETTGKGFIALSDLFVSNIFVLQRFRQQ